MKNRKPGKEVAGDMVAKAELAGKSCSITTKSWDRTLGIEFQNTGIENCPGFLFMERNWTDNLKEIAHKAESCRGWDAGRNAMLLVFSFFTSDQRRKRLE